ncbi:hypothetical protein SAMN04515667_2837 [Formosa sp. Hel1_31_208]|uniref:hypothetical protein n=1 Tax=Formosa sp. Hel1_31_208 TaxID=1798225 RepID=UPI00087A1921|nr:hypothetical protein [Formosa sp. Hel1_31_208]SDS72573.1 hypothetical protein SAMN04515667_2837 [Formosa sp. Hel1_31_208]
MKQLAFKICWLILITSGPIFAQKKVVYSESFSANKNTQAILNLDNTTVAIETSTDGKIHFNYTVEFSQYSKKEIQSFIDDIKVEAVQFENTLTLHASSYQNISKIAYQLDAPFGLTLDNDEFKIGRANDTIYRKSKDSIIKEIRGGEFKNLMFKNFKMLDKNGEKKAIDFKKVKMYKSRFVIKIPAFINVKIIGNHAQISFLDDVTNEISLNLKKGTLKGKYLSNTYNKFKIDQASFEFEGISGGDFSFDNVTNGKIGSLQDVTINSEFSKIEIGEIRDKVNITDFNGEFWFYNWAKDFNRFDFFSEYTKLYFFYPETYDFSLSVVGNNTVNHFENMSITMQPTKSDKKFNMMERKAKGKGHFSGVINLDMVRGILYTANDTFIKPKQ